jgi:hypothetical protein
MYGMRDSVMREPKTPAGDALDRREMQGLAQRERAAERTPAQIEAQLIAAKQELQRWEDAFDLYTEKNPDRYRSQLRIARARVGYLEAELRFRQELPGRQGNRPLRS